jgi:PBP1b-binding outer membrane lipoprotein LpoB
MKLRTALPAAVLSGALLLSACGGGDAKPSKGDLVEGLGTGLDKTDIDEAHLECLADGLLDSSISAKALKQIAAGDEDMELGKADTKIATKVIDDCEDS